MLRVLTNLRRTIKIFACRSGHARKTSAKLTAHTSLLNFFANIVKFRTKIAMYVQSSSTLSEG